MVINSFRFLLFFIIVFLLYYAPPIKGKRVYQNIILFVSGYVFYGFANWKLIPLLLAATGIYYCLGIALGKFLALKDETRSRVATFLMMVGVCFGIGLLLYFKYLNFFIDSFIALFSAIGLHSNLHTFTILVPLGVSYFTFKFISYIVEIYLKKIEPTTDFIAFAVYIGFFPTIGAGPIDRPFQLIPQLQAQRFFDNTLSVDGCRQLLYGLFKKTVIADTILGSIVPIVNDYQMFSGSTLLFSAFLYTIALYCDFSGYSDMAIGIGKILGFRITKNFNYPFFSRNIAEFWRNWHISLTTWLTDYVFMPLNIKFRRLGKLGLIFAIVINFVLCGLWHGANWTFVVFGLYHGLLYIPLIMNGNLNSRKKIAINKSGLPSLHDSLKMIILFILVTLGNILFFSKDIISAWQYITGIFSNSLFSIPLMAQKKVIIVLILILLCIEWMGRKDEYPIKKICGFPRVIRFGIYYAFIGVIILFSGTPQVFIYMQF